MRRGSPHLEGNHTKYRRQTKLDAKQGMDSVRPSHRRSQATIVRTAPFCAGTPNKLQFIPES